MTDFKKVKKFLEELGIEVRQENHSDCTWLTLNVGNNKIDGYMGFFCSFRFDLAEKFIKVEIGE